MYSLEVEHVSKRFGVIQALKDVSFRVAPGEYFCILGPTGAGKTTLLRIIAGLLNPDEGRVLLDGEDITDLPPEEREIAYMPQGYALFPHLTVWENVVYGASMKGLPESRAEMALRMVGLYHRRHSYPHELSGGQQQRIALARVIASGCKVLLLDEPLSALDLLLNIELRYELKSMAKKFGLTVLHVTHDSEEAMSIADRILVLRKGKVQQIGAPSEVYLKPSNLFVARFLGDANLLEGDVIETSQKWFRVHVEGLGELTVNGTPPAKHVVLVFRPEDLEVLMSSPLARKENMVKGIVRDVEFQGFRTRIHVLIGREVELVAEVWSSEGLLLRPGSQISLRLPPEKALVYEYPREGLARAIALE